MEKLAMIEAGLVVLAVIALAVGAIARHRRERARRLAERVKWACRP